METGIFIRVKAGENWEAVDIGNKKVSDHHILDWLRSRGGSNSWAENVVMLLLGRNQISGTYSDTIGSKFTFEKEAS